ncbi:flippase [Candidatus Woesearchaeota archaeon]|nr:flippase [Candidatus Woesearchaeota archaeon]
MEFARKIITNSLWLYGSEIVNKILMFFFIIYLARKLGAEQFGLYTFAISFTLLFMGLINLGMNSLFIRDIARDKEKLLDYHNHILVFRLAASFVCFVIINLLIYILGYDTKTFFIVLFFSIYLIISTFTQLYVSFFRIYEEMQYEAIIRTVEKLFLIIPGLLLLFLGYGLYSISLLYIFSTIVALLLSLYYTRKRYTKIHFYYKQEIMKDIIKRAMPFALFAVFYDIYFRVDVTILNLLEGNVATGLYGSATRITEVFLFIPQIFSRASFPSISNIYKNMQQYLSFVYTKSIKFLLLLIIPVAFFTLIFSEKIVFLFYGSEFIGTSSALVFLMFAMVFIFINTISMHFLISTNNEKKTSLLIAVLAVFNVIFNLILIPYLHIRGAALATLLTELIGFFVTFYLIKKYYDINPVQWYMLKLVVLSALIAYVTHFFAFLNIFVLGAIFAILYLSNIFVLRIIEKDEITLLKSLFLPQGMKK